jgi:hypothetical protein
MAYAIASFTAMDENTMAGCATSRFIRCERFCRPLPVTTPAIGGLVTTNALVLTYALRQVNEALPCHEQLSPSISDFPSEMDPGVKTQGLLDRGQAGVFELWVPSSAAHAGVRSRIVHKESRSGAPRGSWPGSAISPLISPLQKWRTVPSPRMKTVRPGTSPSSALT